MKLTISETDKKGIIRIQLEFEGPVELLQSLSSNHSANTNLTSREQEVMEYLLQGKTTRQIAEELFISPYTVKNHVQNIYEKHGVRSRVELFKILSPFKLTIK